MLFEWLSNLIRLQSAIINNKSFRYIIVSPVGFTGRSCTWYLFLFFLFLFRSITDVVRHVQYYSLHFNSADVSAVISHWAALTFFSLVLNSCFFGGFFLVSDRSTDVPHALGKPAGPFFPWRRLVSRSTCVPFGSSLFTGNKHFVN